MFLIVYADKTKLSTMNGQKGYPVYVRCANLPTNIRNGQGLGGGQQLGILPIVRRKHIITVVVTLHM